MCLVTRTSTLHGVLERGKAFGALVKAAPFVEVKTWLALGAEVFAETGLTVLYPAPWRSEERKRGSSGSEKKPSHLELIESWGVWGRGFLKGLHCLTQKKEKNISDVPVKYFSRGSSAFQRVCFAWDFSFIFLFLFRVRKSTVRKHNSRDGEKLCQADLFQQNTPTLKSLDTNTRAHMFPTNSQLQQEEYIPLGCKAVSFGCYLITALGSNVSITEDYW